MKCARELDRPETVRMSCPAQCSLVVAVRIQSIHKFAAVGICWSHEPAPQEPFVDFSINLNQVQILRNKRYRWALDVARAGCIQMGFFVIISARAGEFN